MAIVHFIGFVSLFLNSLKIVLSIENIQPAAVPPGPGTRNRDMNRADFAFLDVVGSGLTLLTHRNRERQKAQRKDNERHNGDDDTRGSQRFHLFGLWVPNAQHDRQQYHEQEPGGAAVP